MPGANRRSFYRLPMYVRVDLRVSGLRVPVPCTVVDVSGGGCQVQARTMLKTQSLVEFDLPRTGRQPMRLSGRIRKVAYGAKDRMFRYAVEFDTMADVDRDELFRYISEEQRRAITGVREAVPDDDDDESSPLRLQEQRSQYRVEINVPVQYSVGNSYAPPGTATAIDISTGGMRLIVEEIVRQEWVLQLSFTLSSEPLRVLNSLRGGPSPRPFSELHVTARALPGLQRLRGRYIQSFTFVSPDPAVTEEINRYVQTVRVTSIRRR